MKIPGMTRKNVLMISVAMMLALFPGAKKTSAANILWVSDFFADNSFSPPGSDVNDTNFIVMLQNAGHNIWRFNPPPANVLLTQAQIDAINTNDLIIIGRATDSAAFQTTQAAQWNASITKPLIMQSSYLLRASRLGWFTASTTPADGPPTAVTAVDLNDPVIAYIFSGIEMNGSTTANPYDEAIDRNTSQDPDPVVAGGRALAKGVANTAWNVIAEWPAGTAVRGGADILGGYRMYFASGSREAASPIQNAGKENLTATGEALFLHAVEVALNSGMVPNVNPVPPLIGQQTDSLTVERFRPAAFSIIVTQGAPVLKYQWYFNDSPLPGATDRILSFPRADLTNNGQYFVIVTNNFGAATSSPVALTVTQDITAPFMASVGSLDGRSIGVCFNEEVYHPRRNN
jgi:hypothetical protein